MSAWERRSLACSAEGAPRAAGNADAPPAQPNPISPPPPRGSGTGSAVPVSSPGLLQDRLWCHHQRLFLEEPATPGMSVWLVCGCLYGGDQGEPGLWEELWSFSCWAGFHSGKAEPCVLRSALVLLMGRAGEGREAAWGRASTAGRGTRPGRHRLLRTRVTLPWGGDTPCPRSRAGDGDIVFLPFLYAPTHCHKSRKTQQLTQITVC